MEDELWLVCEQGSEGVKSGMNEFPLQVSTVVHLIEVMPMLQGVNRGASNRGDAHGTRGEVESKWGRVGPH